MSLDVARVVVETPVVRVVTGLPGPPGDGGPGGSSNHAALINRDLADQHPIAAITGLQVALDGKAPSAHGHAIADVSGLQAALDGKSATGHGHVIADVSGLQVALDAKAPIASPALIGLPTAPTAAAGIASSQIATTAFVATAIANLIASSPGALDTLDELASALGDDPNFAATITAALGGKMAKAANLSDLTDVAAARSNLGATTIGAQVFVAATAAAIRTLLELGTAAQSAVGDFAAAAHNHNASNINAGTLASARLPVPTATDIGAIKRNAGTAGQFVSGVAADGSLEYDTPAGGGAPGGANKTVQFNNDGTLAGLSDSAVDVANSRIGFGISPTAKVHVKSSASSEVALRVDAASGQTAAVQEWRNIAGTVVGKVSIDGFQPTSLSTARFVNDGGAFGVELAGSVNWFWAGADFNGYGRSAVTACLTNITTRSTSGGLANNYLSESGNTVTNTGAAARVDSDLPERVGYDFTGYIDNANGKRFTCASGDRIRCLDKETALGGYLQSTEVGSFVRLHRIRVGLWAVLAIGGIWTDGTFTFDNTADTTP